MAKLMILCPTSHKLVYTGIDANKPAQAHGREGLLRRLIKGRNNGEESAITFWRPRDSSTRVLVCPECGQEHEWQMTTAYLVES